MQAQLDLRERPVTTEVVRSQPTMTAAIKLALQVSQRDEKGVKVDLSIDAGQWTRIFSGQGHFPHDKLHTYMETVGNEIPLEWLAAKRGYGLVLLEDEKDRKIRELQEQLAEKDKRLEHITEFVRGVKA